MFFLQNCFSMYYCAQCFQEQIFTQVFLIVCRVICQSICKITVHDTLLFVLFSGAAQPPQSKAMHSATRHARAAHGCGRLSKRQSNKQKPSQWPRPWHKAPRPNHMTWHMARGPTTCLPGRRPTHLRHGRRGAHILRRPCRPFADLS